MTPVEEAIAALEKIANAAEFQAYSAAGDPADRNASRGFALEAGYLRQLASRLRADGEGWRPIEEAPRDGTHILLAAGQDHVGEGWWEDNDSDPYPWKFIDTGMMGSRYRNGEDINGAHEGNPHAFMFTHFRPLPDPPR